MYVPIQAGHNVRTVNYVLCIMYSDVYVPIQAGHIVFKTLHVYIIIIQ